MATYLKEAKLVEDFKTFFENFKSPFNIVNSALEFNYLNGRADIVAKTEDGLLIAFEAKLGRWKIALHQAYRNSSFAHFSYVILPESSAQNALKYSYEFLKRGVGLYSVNSDGIKNEINAIKKEPLQPWLTDSAFTFIESF